MKRYFIVTISVAVLIASLIAGVIPLAGVIPQTAKAASGPTCYNADNDEVSCPADAVNLNGNKLGAGDCYIPDPIGIPIPGQSTWVQVDCAKAKSPGNTGCYGNNGKLGPCPIGAVDQSGNALNAGSNCYIELASGTGGSVWKQVDCGSVKAASPGCYNGATSVSCPSTDANGNPIDPTKCYEPTAEMGDGTGTEFAVISCSSVASTAAQTQQDDTTATCESSDFSLSWIFCGVINGLSDALNGIYSDFIKPLLQIQPINVSDPSADATHTYDIWKNFRLYGDIVLVVALLVVVFAEAAGGGLIDAYTAKKMLPRILVAAILINLSIYIVAVLVDVSNIVGNGIASLIAAPFSNAGDFHITLSGLTSGLGLGTGLAAVGAVWALGGALIQFLLVFVLLPGFLALLGALFTIVIRQGLILFLVITSPIAFALYCLPNTEQYFKKWWDLLLRTLLVYPLIAGIFAIANVLAVTINHSYSNTGGLPGTSLGVVVQLMSLAALLMPLFLIPFSFKIAGGAIGSISQTLNGLGKKAFEGIRGNPNDPNSLGRRVTGRFRMQRAEKGLTGAAINTRLNPKYLRPGGGGLKRRREDLVARKSADRVKFGGEYDEADAIYQANKGNDNFLLAAANPKLAQGKLSAVEAKESAARASGDDDAANGYATQAARWRQAIAQGRLVHSAPATRLKALQDLSATGFQWSPGQKGYNELAETVGDITGARLTYDATGRNVTGATGAYAGAYAEAMDQAQFNLKNGGRFDIGGINNGKGYEPEVGIGKASGYTIGQAKTETYLGGAEHYMIARLTQDGKTKDTAGMATDLHGDLLAGTATASQVGKWHSKLLEAKYSATGANKDEIQKQIDAIEGVARQFNAEPTPNTEAELKVKTDLIGEIQKNQREQGEALIQTL